LNGYQLIVTTNKNTNFQLKSLFCKKEIKMAGQERSAIKIGLEVGIVLKADQRSGKITEGVVSAILTSSSFHPHGIKVRLTTGEIGRVKLIK